MYVPFSIVAGSFMWFSSAFLYEFKVSGFFFVVSTPKSLECLNFLSSCFTENLIERLSIKTPVSTGVTRTTRVGTGLTGTGSITRLAPRAPGTPTTLAASSPS